MKTIDLFVKRNEKLVTNISKAYKTATVKSLRMRYATFTSYDENNEYTGISIKLCNIDHEHGIFHFEICKDGCHSTHFWTDAEDDPIIAFISEPGVEHHVFEKISDYEINQDIKEGGLYKFQDKVTNEWFLGVVHCVETYEITLSKFDIIRDKTFNPTLYTLCQQVDIISGISTTDKFCIDKFKNYTVTEIFDLTTAFGDDEDDMEDDEE